MLRNKIDRHVIRAGYKYIYIYIYIYIHTHTHTHTHMHACIHAHTYPVISFPALFFYFGNVRSRKSSIYFHTAFSCVSPSTDIWVPSAHTGLHDHSVPTLLHCDLISEMFHTCILSFAILIASDISHDPSSPITVSCMI